MNLGDAVTQWKARRAIRSFLAPRMSSTSVVIKAAAVFIAANIFLPMLPEIVSALLFGLTITGAVILFVLAPTRRDLW